MRRLLARIASWLRAWLRPVSAPPPTLEEAERRRAANVARLERLVQAREARRRATEIQQEIIQRRAPRRDP